jgi:hypothetical protein
MSIKLEADVVPTTEKHLMIKDLKIVHQHNKREEYVFEMDDNHIYLPFHYAYIQ